MKDYEFLNKHQHLQEGVKSLDLAVTEADVDAEK